MSTETLAPSTKRISKPEKNIRKSHVVLTVTVFPPYCVTTIHSQFTSPGTRITYWLCKKYWQMGTCKKNPEPALLIAPWSLKTTSFGVRRSRTGWNSVWEWGKEHERWRTKWCRWYGTGSPLEMAAVGNLNPGQLMLLRPSSTKQVAKMVL